MATLVYPNAIGWGVETPGGRGGRIVRVTTTADGTQPGTLRYALQLKEPRTVIFDVGGVFDVGTDDVWIGGGCNHLTVFGQTAPYPGVNIRGIIRIRTHDLFLQHLAVWGVAKPPELLACVDLLGTSIGCQRVVIDHCTLVWGSSKCLQTWSGEQTLAQGDQGVSHITVSNCLIGEPCRSPKGDNWYGLIFQEYTERGAILRNLFMDCSDRSPAFHDRTSVVVANNLSFNPGQYAIHYWPAPLNTGPVEASVVGNVILPGANTAAGGARITLERAMSGSQIYLADNIAPSEPVIASPACVSKAPVAWPTHMALLPAEQVYAYLVAEAGARPWDRDPVGRRIVSDLEQRISRRADAVSGYGDYPHYQEARRPLTLPDYPNSIGADGYSNLERWVWQFDRPVVDPGPDLDMMRGRLENALSGLVEMSEEVTQQQNRITLIRYELGQIADAM